MNKCSILLPCVLVMLAMPAFADNGYNPTQDAGVPRGSLRHLAQAALLADQAAYVRESRGFSKAVAGQPIAADYGTAPDGWGQPGDRVPAWYELYANDVHLVHWQADDRRHGRRSYGRKPVKREHHEFGHL